MIFRYRARDHFILPAEPRDIDRIAQLHAIGFARGWNSEEVSGLMAQPETNLLVARTVGAPDKPVAGFNLFRQSGPEAEILSIAVDPRARRQGVADNLMRAAIRILQADRVAELFLEVDETNTAAVALYRQLGFVTVGERQGYYSADKTNPRRAAANALVMRLDLL